MATCNQSLNDNCGNATSATAICLAASSSYISLNVLPDEILEFIFTYLPPYGDLEHCSLVCKRWQLIVKNLVRRSQLNLEKGLADFRLRWEVYSQQTAASLEANRPNNRSQSGSQPMPIIAGRFAHSTVRLANSMYVFGGGSSSDTTFNDLWRFDLTHMRWSRPLATGTYPSPKGSASMVAWRDKLVLFGGWRYPSLHPPYQPWCLFDELHYYDLVKDRWLARNSLPCPPPMAGHSASVHANRMIIFGGYQIKDDVNVNSNDTWVLDLAEQRWWQPLFVGNTRPAPRYGQIQVELDKQHLLIVGGCGGANRVYTDAWLLDMTRDAWSWKQLSVRNKHFGAVHMWCNPGCRVNNYLVVVGPSPKMPLDFQIMKQSRVPAIGGSGLRYAGLGQAPAPPPPQRVPVLLPERRPGQPANPRDQQRAVRLGGAALAPQEQYLANRRAILNQHMQQAQQFMHNNNVNNNNNGSGNNNHYQPRSGRLSDLHSPPAPAAAAVPAAPAPAAAADGDADAAQRLQRNLALRCRDNEPLLPKRFDEHYEDPFRMAAFNVPGRSRSASRDHSERIRRMEEKMNAIRNSRRSAPAHVEPQTLRAPSPKRLRCNVQSLFVCDISSLLQPDPNCEPGLDWVEYKNFGVLSGAPDRLILSSLIAGNGELILFGGVHKETLTDITHHVSNSIHFLSVPRDII
ncbi:F-box only protein 42 [Drosophila grimshawi]|uniref:GH23072 n=1 Tax=Drosophila grimshawi TaxID=7222 RepID=B4JWL8_DROGR|nr:F-box only protein 42 [Drosophila grimshawi]EDV98356.1 GH23072 [Drosophila grimshawi]